MKNPEILILSVFPLLYTAVQIAWTGKAYKQFYTYSHLKDKGKKKRNFIMKRLAAAVMTGTGILFIIIALAHPLRSGRSAQLSGNFRDFSLVIDISNSMTADDNGISRLERVKNNVSAFIYSCGEESRFSVTVFKGKAVTVLPLISDRDLAVSVIDGLSPDMFTSAGTAFTEAVEKAVSLFPDHEKTERKMVLFTDGEESVRGRFKSNINKLSEIISEKSADILIVMPDRSSGSVIDSGNSSHISVPDFSLMNKTAEKWGGKVINISDFSISSFSEVNTNVQIKKDYTSSMLVLALLFLFSASAVRRLKL